MASRELELRRAHERLSALPAGLREHILRVRDISLELAQRFGADPQQAEMAALLHDIARAARPQSLLAAADEYNLAISPVEQSMPLLLHGPVAAELARRALGVTDRTVLDAVAFHTTGRRGMSLLEKVVFLADKLDPQKLDYSGADELAELARKDLDRAVLKYLDLQLAYLVEKGLPISPLSVEARNEILAQLR